MCHHKHWPPICTTITSAMTSVLQVIPLVICITSIIINRSNKQNINKISSNTGSINCLTLKLDHLDNSNVKFDLIVWFGRFWYGFKAGNFSFETIQKTWRLLELMGNYKEIKWVYINWDFTCMWYKYTSKQQIPRQRQTIYWWKQVILARKIYIGFLFLSLVFNAKRCQ